MEDRHDHGCLHAAADGGLLSPFDTIQVLGSGDPLPGDPFGDYRHPVPGKSAGVWFWHWRLEGRSYYHSDRHIDYGSCDLPAWKR